MKIVLTYIAAILMILLSLSSCSDLDNNISPQPIISVHPNNFANEESANFHGNYIKQIKWNLNVCKQCHSADYTGGITNVSCFTCHTQPKGPEDCSTCHGVFNDSLRIAPPRSINGDTTTTASGVGAHANHLYENKLGNTVECIACHNVPDNIYSTGHIDSDLPAEITFHNQAILNVATDANYNSSTNSCSNIYCHGNFKFLKDSASVANQFIYISDTLSGNNKSVNWTKVSQGEAECGSCHDLPPKGHLPVAITACAGCHIGIVDGQGNIIDKSKHINGQKNVFGN